MTKRVFFHKYKVLDFTFKQTRDDFIVEEIPINFTNRGNFIVLKIKKQDMSTWDLVEKLSSFLKVYSNEIGYAGLKDKNATTTQYISIPKKYSKQIRQFRHKNIEILDSFLHKEKLNIGDLKGNIFKINLLNSSKATHIEIEKRVSQISKVGVPNYFGYQRFGKEVEVNLQKAKEIVNGDTIIKDKKLSKMLISAYQSEFFNSWLVYRINNSKDKFDLLNGDVFLNKKTKKYFTPKAINEKVKEDYKNSTLSLTGLLPGRKVFRTILKAREVEEKFDDMFIQDKGYRREAIINIKNVKIKFDEKNSISNLEFFLPKGSYATVFIENIAGKNFKM